MLAMADRRGRVWASIPGLANRARVSIPACEKALGCFLSPDEYSRTKDFDGVRIEVIDGGWRLLNHQKYRDIRDEETRKEQNALAQARFRSKQSKPGVSHDKPTRKPNAEAEAEADAIKPPISPKGDGFERFWSAYPKKLGKVKAESSFKTALKQATLEKILSAIEAQKNSEQWKKEGGQFIPYPAKWLNQGQWDDVVAASAPKTFNGY